MLQAQLLRDAYDLAVERTDELVHCFYDLLHTRYPNIYQLFDHADSHERRGMMLASLTLLVVMADHPERLKTPLAKLGLRLRASGARPEHYPAVAECLCGALHFVLGSRWNPQLRRAWLDAYETVTSMTYSHFALAEF